MDNNHYTFVRFGSKTEPKTVLHRIKTRDPEKHTIITSQGIELNSKDYKWLPPQRKSKPHPNPRAGFIVSYTRIGFNGNDYIKLETNDYVTR